MLSSRKNIGVRNEGLDVSRFSYLTPTPNPVQTRVTPFEEGAVDYGRNPEPEKKVSPRPANVKPRITPEQRGEIRLSRRIANLTKRGRSYTIVTVYRGRKGIVYPIQKAIANKKVLPNGLTNGSKPEKGGDITPDKNSKPGVQTTEPTASDPEVNQAGFLSGNALLFVGLGLVALLFLRK